MLWPVNVYFFLVLLIVAGMLAFSFLLGQRHRERATNFPYESGIMSEGSARVRLWVSFYLVAMFFVVFDLEAVFLFARAVAARQTFYLTAYFITLLSAFGIVSVISTSEREADPWRITAVSSGGVREWR